jgi:hypothetical protein
MTQRWVADPQTPHRGTHWQDHVTHVGSRIRAARLGEAEGDIPSWERAPSIECRSSRSLARPDDPRWVADGARRWARMARRRRRCPRHARTRSIPKPSLRSRTRDEARRGCRSQRAEGIRANESIAVSLARPGGPKRSRMGTGPGELSSKSRSRRRCPRRARARSIPRPRPARGRRPIEGKERSQAAEGIRSNESIVGLAGKTR